MDKIFLRIAIAQGMIDLFLNAYQRNHAFTLSDEDIIHFLEHFESTLEFISTEISRSKLVSTELLLSLESEAVC